MRTALIALLLAAGAHCGGDRPVCVYQGVTHAGGTNWTDGCASCSCGISGKSAGQLACFTDPACASDAGSDAAADTTD
jgi:hypothetical protein